MPVRQLSPAPKPHPVAAAVTPAPPSVDNRRALGTLVVRVGCALHLPDVAVRTYVRVEIDGYQARTADLPVGQTADSEGWQALSCPLSTGDGVSGVVIIESCVGAPEG